jgi:hypothetical protein
MLVFVRGTGILGLAFQSISRDDLPPLLYSVFEAVSIDVLDVFWVCLLMAVSLYQFPALPPSFSFFLTRLAVLLASCLPASSVRVLFAETLTRQGPHW